MKKLALIISLLVLVSGLLAACAAPGPVASTSTTASPDPTQAAGLTATDTAIPLPSATPAPGRVILLAPASAPTLAERFQAELAGLAGPAGLGVETLTELTAAQITSEVRAVVALAAPANLAELLAAAPQVQFVVISAADLPPTANLTVIRRRPEMHAFLSGYIVALLSPDYRAAGLLPSDGPIGALLPEAFVNGGRYYCGTCAPGWPLNFVYPAAVASPASSDAATWQAGLADAFDNKKVDVVYLSPEAAAHAEIQGYLQGRTQFDRTMIFIGAEAPPALLQPQWAASVVFDDLAVLREVWPAVQAGSGGVTVDAPLVLENVNSTLLEGGKMRLVNDLIEEMRSGRIYPLTVAR
jgi:hypothetical protein